MSAHEDGVRAVAEAIHGKDCGCKDAIALDLPVDQDYYADLGRAALVASLRWAADRLDTAEHATGSRDFGRGYAHALASARALADEIEAS